MAPNLQAVIIAVDRLLSPAAPQVLGLLGQSKPQPERLRKVVAIDPVLAVRIVDHANQSYYARRVPVASADRALTRLGWLAARSLLVRLVLEQATATASSPLAEQLWSRTLDTALLCRLLARTSGRVDPALAYTAGLTHSLGQLGLLQVFQDPYRALLNERPSGPQLARAERARFGFDHAQVAAGVLARMNLPEALHQSIKRQYRANLLKRDWADPSVPLAGILQLSHLTLHPDGSRLDQPEWIATRRVAGRLGLTAPGLADLRVRFDAARRRATDTAEAA